jgi:hypothetical protein
VLAGSAVTPSERAELERAVRNAETASTNLHFSVYLGPVEGSPRAAAERLHAALDAPDSSVLVFCDPEHRALEIVTGAVARRSLSDQVCSLAAASMESSFAADDIVGGLVVGIQQLGEAARAPRTLHTRHVS